MNNIIIVKLDSTYTAVYSGIWQYDYGQILRITGVEFPKAVEIQFSLNEKSGSTITRIGITVDGVTEVQIPDELLKNEGHSQDYSIYAYIYLTDETSGNTEYQIVLHVKSRTKPENPTEEPLPEPNIFHETIVAVNASAERAEKAEQKAKASATEASKYASSASDSAAIAEKTKEAALKEVGEKKREAIEAIQNQTADSKAGLEQSIKNADASKKELDESIQTAGDTKTALDKSTELAGTAKTELDTSTQKAGEAKTALDGFAKTAGEMQETLSATVKQAGTLDTSLGEKIETGTQLKTDIIASGEKAVKDIQTAGSEQLSKIQAVAEEFTADQEQITTNKEDIGSLKKEVAKNTANDADTKRKLDALWKLNQGISYQFETDDTEAYQKTVPSGAKLASVKKIGGRTIVWNQLVTKQAESEYRYGLDFSWLDNGRIRISGTSTFADEDPNVCTILNSIEVIGNHKYLFKLTGTDRFCILGYGVGDATPTAQKLIFNALDSGTENISICGIKEKIESGTVIYDIVCPQIYDLTKMFGTGNEPSTPEEFEAMFPADYYPYNAGEPMSAPVNEVMEQGKNYFDFSKLVSDDVNVMDYEKQTITVPAKTNNTGYNQTLRDLCPGITPGTYVFSMKRSNPNSGNGSYFLEASKDFLTDTPIELTDALLDNHIAWYNNSDSEIENVISEIQIEKNSVKTSYSQYHKKSYKIPQAILDLDGYGESGNFVDFVEKKYHKGDRTIDISDILGDTFQEPFEVEAGGTLTFHNSNGDGYRIPVPNEEEYIVSLAEVGGGASE